MSKTYVFGPAERRALQPTERLRPSTWATEHRWLTRMQSPAFPGRWRESMAPYLTGIMDACFNGRWQEITIIKAGQVGVSEAIRNVIGWMAHQEPDPVLIVLPDEKTARDIMKVRLTPLFRDTPALSELLSPAKRDTTLTSIILTNGFTLRLGWSGSPATLAAHPCRLVFNDEVDKFKEWSGREADPISLGYVRTQTFGDRRLIVNVSTPVTTEGLLYRRFDSMPVKMRYHVPCPHCRRYQVLVFARLKWPKLDELDNKAKAEAIELDKLAWYECEHCGERIEERDRPAMIRAGVWAFDGQSVVDGRVIGAEPRGRRLGIHCGPAFLALWVSWHAMAAQYLRSLGSQDGMQDFANSWLGEPFKHQIAHAKTDTFAGKRRDGAPARIVPEWARVLIASADSQIDRFYWVVRAWGDGFRSQRIDHGIAWTFAELRERTLDVLYPMAGGTERAAVQTLGIDSGGTDDMTPKVYEFALSDPARIHAMKGEGSKRRSGPPVRTRPHSYKSPHWSAPLDLFLTTFDAPHYEDRLSYAIHATITSASGGQVEQWALDDTEDEDYERQLASRHKVLKRKAGREVAEWEAVSEGAPDHYRDCEKMQFALADMLRVDLLRQLPPPPPQQPTSRPQHQPERPRMPTRPFRRDY